ncbi:MAG: hypothetical protein ABSF46_27120, partial [Terriglobia bacterium]
MTRFYHLVRVGETIRICGTDAADVCHDDQVPLRRSQIEILLAYYQSSQVQAQLGSPLPRLTNTFLRG